MRDLVFGLSRQNVKKQSLASLSIDVDWLFSLKKFYSSIKFQHILMISVAWGDISRPDNSRPTFLDRQFLTETFLDQRTFLDRHFLTGGHFSTGHFLTGHFSTGHFSTGTFLDQGRLLGYVYKLG